MTAPTLPTAPTPEPTPASAPVGPSVHIRALATWLTIFPLVAIGMTLLAPVTEGWHPVLRALVLTLVVVPLAVYLVVPRVVAVLVRARRPRS